MTNTDGSLKALGSAGESIPDQDESWAAYQRGAIHSRTPDQAQAHVMQEIWNITLSHHFYSQYY